MSSRRQFLHQAAGTSLALAVGLNRDLAAAEAPVRPLNILLLGGTRFLGVHLTEAALARGHQVTFFNRGRTRTELFPNIERLVGNRDGESLGGLQALEGRRFDAVIDTSGYVPRHVALSASLLASQASHYLFISTVSVYRDFSQPNDEESALGTLEDPTIEKVDGNTYGPLKALCEQAALNAYRDQHCSILRPGLIVGPEDNTDRFTYWPARCARGGRFIAPGSPKDPIQIIDARDLAAFSLRCLEQSLSGTFNIISPWDQFTIGDLVTNSVSAAKEWARPAQEPSPVWMPAEFLSNQNIAAWSDMPVWVPDGPDSYGFSRTSVKRAQAAGMRIRPLADTVADTLRWHLKRPTTDQSTLRAGVKAERESEVLAAWDAAQV